MGGMIAKAGMLAGGMGLLGNLAGGGKSGGGNSGGGGGGGMGGGGGGGGGFGRRGAGVRASAPVAPVPGPQTSDVQESGGVTINMGGADGGLLGGGMGAMMGGLPGLMMGGMLGSLLGSRVGGTPTGVAQAQMSSMLPAMSGPYADAMNSQQNPSGPLSAAHFMNGITQGGGSFAGSLAGSGAMRGPAAGQMSSIASGVSNGQSFRSAFTAAGGNQYGAPQSAGIATSLATKASGRTGVPIRSAVIMGNAPLRAGTAAVGKSNAYYPMVQNAALGASRALSGDILAQAAGAPSPLGPAAAAPPAAPGMGYEGAASSSAGGASIPFPAGGTPMINAQPGGGTGGSYA